MWDSQRENRTVIPVGSKERAVSLSPLGRSRRPGKLRATDKGCLQRSRLFPLPLLYFSTGERLSHTSKETCSTSCEKRNYSRETFPKSAGKWKQTNKTVCILGIYIKKLQKYARYTQNINESVTAFMSACWSYCHLTLLFLLACISKMSMIIYPFFFFRIGQNV